MPVTWFQVVNRSVIAWRYSWAQSRCRPGRKCGEMPLTADKNRWACQAPGEPRHGLFPLPGGLVGVFGPVVQVLGLAVFTERSTRRRAAP